MGKYVAKPYVAGTPQAEVIGQSMISFADNLRADIIQPILKQKDLEKIEEDKWYPHQLWLDILKSMNDTLVGQASEAFVAFGMKVVDNAVMPPEIQTVEDVLNALHAIHHANLRNVPEEEGYQVQKVEDNHYIVFHNTPNPEDAIYGFLWGLVRRFRPGNTNFTVKKIENPSPDTSRSAYDIRWGS